MYRSISKPISTIILLSFFVYFSFYFVALAQETENEATSSTDVSVTSETEVDSPSSDTRPEVRRLPVQDGIQLRDRLEEAKTERVNMVEDRQASRTAQMEERQAIRTEQTEARHALREERQAKLEESRQQRILNLSANISNRMEAAITRLFDIIGRFELRIETLKQSDVDTTEAEASLRNATQSLVSARETLGNIDSQVYIATTSEAPITEWKLVKETFQEAGRLIRQSHQELRDVVAKLKFAVQATNNTRGVSPAVENSAKVDATSTF